MLRHAVAVAVAVARRRIHTQPTHSERWLFVDSVFPVRLGTWDLRYYFGLFRQEAVLQDISSILQDAQNDDFLPVSVEPHVKDGGVFVRFHHAPDADLNALLVRLRAHVRSKGGVPSSAGLRRGDIWLVQGSPWREDMNRFATPILRVAFDGPDPHEEALYSAFRPYGRILDLTPPAPVPGAPYRAATLTYANLRAAIVARNVAHGRAIDSASTTVRTAFMPPIQAHVARDWVTSHPRISIPVLVFLLGTLTYTIFDPVRRLMIESKVTNWLDYRELRVYQWIRKNTIDRFSLRVPPAEADIDAEGAWQERKDAQAAVQNYLADMPTTVAFVHGPQGAGKSRMLSRIMKEADRATLIIDYSELARASSDMRLIDALAQQTGYWPVFTMLNSMNNLIDLASVGLIGQKAGISTSLPEQVKQILEITGAALRGVSSTHVKKTKRARTMASKKEERKKKEDWTRERVRRGVWSDPRLGAVAGVGVMSELGGGEEAWRTEDEEDVRVRLSATGGSGSESAEVQDEKSAQEQGRKDREKAREADDALQAVHALPIVLVKNFASGGKEEVTEVFARWAAALVEGQVAHVIVVSDNRENSKSLAKALPSKPLNVIALSDADSASALQFVKMRLHEADVPADFTSEQNAYIERLGGRASDLASLIHKVRSGQRVEEAVEDIINRGMSELRKNAFGDDVDDAKALPWTREQAWAVLKALAHSNEVPYHDLLVNYPFKGDEAALRSMEKSELVTIGTLNGRPSVIRPGKPVYRYVFERLVKDPIFQATQDLAYNTKLVEAAEATIRACEQELTTLSAMPETSSSWSWSRATDGRVRYLLGKLRGAQVTVERLDKTNGELKKTLARGG
ncbi:exonuclease [Auriscalpium vulgare]|uniref:Exonuclease n=1 Tax=Auriscalpium vulgare TaxID=40419 RepID=A0ACB8RVX6_9AGAM|nr:exonuclease [Auriscalpium vulgare]